VKVFQAKIYLILLLILSVSKLSVAANYYVTTVAEINSAVSLLQPGDTVTMKNQVWMNANIVFYGTGTAEDSIYLRAETLGWFSLAVLPT
jgi:hypothetical protein